jgi:WhiB family transcriptional regulator, redox-sensing transcriptional regulator
METIDNTASGALNRVSGYATAARRANGMNWRLAAACRSADPELFFPRSGSGKAREQIAEAKVVCAGCPVRRQCLQFALRTRPQGIWGGLTELERHSAAKADGPRKRTVAGSAGRPA